MMRGEREGSAENEVELYMMMCVRREHFYSVHVVMQLRRESVWMERKVGKDYFGSGGDLSLSLHGRLWL